jgi:hypothetical protein
MTTTTDRRGWGFPVNSRKAHYFTSSGRSLCGRWVFFGALEDSRHDHTENCADCRKRRAKNFGEATR